MSRSYRKTPIIPFTSARSEKKDKQLYNRKLRRALLETQDYDSLPSLKEVSNPLAMAKDGKVLINDEIYSLDPERYDKILRK